MKANNTISTPAKKRRMETKVSKNSLKQAPKKKGALKADIIVKRKASTSSKYISRFISAMDTLSEINEDEIKAITANIDRILAKRSKVNAVR